MANRNVFKFLSSVGPGGVIATFCEKICHNLYFDAYEQGDPAQAPSQAFQEKAKQQRQEYVELLFETRGRLERDIDSLSETTQLEAYKELAQVIVNHKVKIAKSEQNRLARERLFHKPNSMQYKRLVEAARRVDADTTDNLMKMALHIVKKAEAHKLKEEFEKIAGTSGGIDLEGGSIEERISHNRAQELLNEWHKILAEYKTEGGDTDALYSNGTGNNEGLINHDEGSNNPQLENLKDKLFIATGEDMLDTWEAFAHYNLQTRI